MFDIKLVRLPIRKSMDMLSRLYSTILTTIFVLGTFISIGGKGFGFLIDEHNFKKSIMFLVIYFVVDLSYFMASIISIHYYFRFNLIGQFVHHFSKMNKTHLLIFFLLYASILMVLSIVFCCFL